MLDKSCLNKKVSCFKNYRSPNNPKPVNLITWLTSDKYKKDVDLIRSIDDKKKRDKVKASLPAITPSGLFTKRAKSALIKHTGLMCIDIDYKDNIHLGNFDELKQHLSNILNVAYCGLSVSGNGYFVLIPIAYSDLHEQHFDSLQDDFAKLNIIIDAACRDVSRLRGYSYDENGYFNHLAIVYEKTKKTQIKPTKIHSYSYSYQPNNKKHLSNEEIVKLLIEQICKRRANFVENYNDWFAVGCSLANEFGEAGREYFHLISQFSSKYDRQITDKQFTKCIKWNSKATLGTFMDYCKKENILLKDVLKEKSRMEKLTKTDTNQLNNFGYPAFWDE